MSQIALCLVDAETEWWGEPHASEVDVVLGALAAEPETLGELEAAMQRFARPGETVSLRHWRGKPRDEPYDAGMCVVHLPGRMIACESTYSTASREGSVWCGERDGEGRDVWVNYRLPDDWTFTSDIWHWRAHAKAAAKKRLALPPLDARPVLYEGVCEFLVDECLAARNEAAGEWSPPEGWELRELSHRVQDGREPTARDAVAEIHARWLMTPSDDLRGQTPREVMQAKQRFLGEDLQMRANQWSAQGECPPPLHVETVAYRYAGFGSHEFLVYYDLVRELVWKCWERVVARWETELAEGETETGWWVTVDGESQRSSRDGKPGFDREAETAHLREQKGRWLQAPNFEELSGEVPQDVIETERRRIPATGSPHDHMIDDDCPLCQMMAELPGPMFWHLDGCNNDDDFPFSCFLETYEEWEQEQRDDEEFSRRCAERERLREAGLLPAEEDQLATDGVWQRSYIAPPTPDMPASVRLFGIDSRLAELVENLRTHPESAGSVESLNRSFANLGDVLENSSTSLIGPVISRMCDELGTTASVRTDLGPKCEDLARHLRGFEKSFVPGMEDGDADPP